MVELLAPLILLPNAPLELRLAGCGIVGGIAPSSFISLPNAISSHAGLRCLDVSSNSLGSSGVTSIVSALKTHAHSLEELGLSFTNPGEEGLQSILHLFDHWLLMETTPVLKVLALAGAGFGNELHEKDQVAEFVSRFRKLVLLERLDLSENGFDVDQTMLMSTNGKIKTGHQILDTYLAESWDKDMLDVSLNL